MKHLFLFFLLLASLFAEPSFNDIQKLIDNHQYKQAKFALQLVIANHPNSAKAYYTLAQANAGLGDLPSANESLFKAKALDPQLAFASSSAISSLEQAITPQTHLIKSVESSNFWWYALLFVTPSIIVMIIIYRKYKAEEPKPTATPSSKYDYPTYTSSYSTPTTEVYHHHDSSVSTLGTVAVAAGTAAVVSSMMSDHPSHYDEQPTHSYQPESTSPTWDDSTTKSTSWDSSSSSSSSWDSSSSSSDSSWD